MPIWINITDQEQEIINSCSDLQDLAKRIREMKESRATAEANGVIGEAIEQYAARSNDDVEIDEDCAVSKSDAGFWVQAWVHVANDDVGEE